MANAVVGASTLLSLVFLGSAMNYRSRRFAAMVTPRPTVLVERGQWIEKHLHQERVTPSDIFGAMHRSGIAKLEDVQWAVLQGDGKIAIVPVEEMSTGRKAHPSANDTEGTRGV